MAGKDHFIKQPQIGTTIKGSLKVDSVNVAESNRISKAESLFKSGSSDLGAGGGGGGVNWDPSKISNCSKVDGITAPKVNGKIYATVSKAASANSSNVSKPGPGASKVMNTVSKVSADSRVVPIASKFVINPVAGCVTPIATVPVSTVDESETVHYVRSTPYLDGKPPQDRPAPTPVPPKPTSDKYLNPEDVVCVACICTKHHRMAITNIENKGLYLPHQTCKLANQSLSQIVRDLLRRIISTQSVEFRNFRWIVERIQVPKTNHIILRFTYRIEVGRMDSTNRTRQSSCICQPSESRFILFWLSYNDLCQKLPQFWGPEPKFILEQVIKPNVIFSPHSEHYSMWWEVTTDELLNNIRKSTSSLLSVIRCGNMPREQIFSLYNEFVIQCYPSKYMTVCSFQLFFQKLGLNFDSARTLRYFKSFDHYKSSFIKFYELLCGLAIYSRRLHSCVHESCIMKIYEFVFRYYATKPDRLNVDDLCRIVMDVTRKPETMAAQPDEQEKTLMAEIRERIEPKLERNLELTFTEFYNLARSGKLFQMLGIETSFENLFETRLRIFPDTGDLMPPAIRLRNRPLKTIQTMVLNSLYDMRCDSCRRSRYFLSSHIISLSELGEVHEINRLGESSPISPMAKRFRLDIHEKDIHVLANDFINKINKFAIFMFGPEDMVTEENARLVENWFFSTKEDTINYVKMITSKVGKIFAMESRVLNISPPCYVFGDIHGNLKDLLLYSQVIWKSSPFINHSKYLFLGDYVDRGQYGVECIIYLFCLKILAPYNFFLLRGNHEIREVQEQFSFFGECVGKFNAEVWEAINSALDYLPIAAVVDEKMFCSHGGIPFTVNTMDQLRSVPNPIENPVNVSQETWEILWNDPIAEDDFQKLADFERIIDVEYGVGFARNTKRGTGYLYSNSATKRFFSKNQIEYLLRAHEVFDEGFHFHHGGTVITVFSSSKYFELMNRAAVLLVDRRRIRIIQLKEENHDE